MDRRLIFLDIDGTLLPPGDMLIPESTLAALDSAKANGHRLFLCTGRNHRMTEPLLRHDCFAGHFWRCQDDPKVEFYSSKERRTAEQRSGALAQSHGRWHVHAAAFRLQRGTAV